MKRQIIKIDEDKCTGCGLCIPNCPEGAIQIIDGKARLISDLLCDGLGACLGHCPEGAIEVEEREAESYDEDKVMANILRQGENVVRAHLRHLKEHGQTEFYEKALDFLRRTGSQISAEESKPLPCGCPGSRMMQLHREEEDEDEAEECCSRGSQLTQWPVQMHLLSPQAPFLRKSHLLLCADCVAYAVGDFHKDHLHGKSLAIACPKLDDGQDSYLEKLTAFIDEAQIETLTVMIMEVPCCRGLLRLAQQAVAKASRKIPLKLLVVGVRGDILQEEWIS